MKLTLTFARSVRDFERLGGDDAGSDTLANRGRTLVVQGQEKRNHLEE